jgi:FkbH-like protein
MELAEVQAAFPALECVQFKPRDEADVYRLLQHLRDRFGKDTLGPEDALRRDSLRAGEAFRTSRGTGAIPDSFLQDAAATLTLQFVGAHPDPRALELVNKTNQFNLNGRRCTEGAWLSYVQDPGTILMEGSYKDKFGPLGKIAVLAGRVRGATFVVETWVMSCRAFARRIEHHCLEALFARLGVATVEFAFAPTARNGPIQDALAALLGQPPAPGARLSHAEFRARCPALFHNMEVISDV